MTNLMRPEELWKVTHDIEMKKAAEQLVSAKKKEEEKKALFEMFSAREISPHASDRINAAVQRAAEQGLNEIEVFTFDSMYCNDGGRRINNNDPDWPESLEGFAKKAYDYYYKELQPLGYKLRVQVLDYPGDMPGKIGFFLRW